MFVCQWHLDVPYGRQGDALRVMEAWGKEKLATSVPEGEGHTRDGRTHRRVAVAHRRRGTCSRPSPTSRPRSPTCARSVSARSDQARRVLSFPAASTGSVPRRGLVPRRRDLPRRVHAVSVVIGRCVLRIARGRACGAGAVEARVLLGPASLAVAPMRRRAIASACMIHHPNCRELKPGGSRLRKSVLKGVAFRSARVVSARRARRTAADPRRGSRSDRRDRDVPSASRAGRTRRARRRVEVATR